MCTNLFSVLFAEDTTGLAKGANHGANLQNVISFVNLELQKIANWFRSNKMQLNASKTKYIIFRTKNKHIDPQAVVSSTILLQLFISPKGGPTFF
jgi:intein-encoded DNA endonuclease-like protein